MVNTIKRPIAKLVLYMAAKNMNITNIKFPKSVSNKLTNKLGIANIITHNTSNNVINPTTRLRFFLENTLENETAIYII
jgi:hypothetical protein